MRSDCRSFDEFWTAYTVEQVSTRFRLRRAGLSLARLALRQRGDERWRWTMAATALTAGKLLAGTFLEECEARASARSWASDARSLAASATWDVAAREADWADVPAGTADTAWAAWI